MDTFVHEEKLTATRRQLVGIALWAGMLILFAALGGAWYWLALIGANLLFELRNLVNRLQTGYVLTIDQLLLKQRETVLIHIPLAGIKGVYRGTFRELVKSPALREIQHQRIQAVPKLGGSKEVTVIIFGTAGNNAAGHIAEEYKPEEYKAEEYKAVFIQPSLTLQLVLEQHLNK
jgi:hypothetical protein